MPRTKRAAEKRSKRFRSEFVDPNNEVVHVTPENSTSALFADRQTAGRELGEHLRNEIGGNDLLVLALPRGGVAVGYEVAQALDCPLDVLVVRKLGVPGQEELAMGAMAAGGARVINESLVQKIGLAEQEVEEIARSEENELDKRVRRWRGDRPVPSIRGKQVIVVDDGVATGASMSVALQVVRSQEPAELIAALPVAPADAYRNLEPNVDELICLRTPDPFISVGSHYRDFSEVTDAQVTEFLEKATRPE